MSDRSLTSAAPVQVKQAAAPALQRTCACGQHSYGEGECAACKQRRGGMVQRAAAGSAGGEAPPIVHEVLRSPGQPLDAPTRAAMEPRFGHDFSRVRVHTGPRAAESARAVSALAYTVGQSVVFGGGQYAPGTRAGQRLLAHELTHVVQQQHHTGRLNRLAIGPADDAHEHEASRAAEQLTAVQPAPAPLRVQRQSAGSGTAPPTGGAASSAPPTSTCSQQDIDDIRREALVWLDDIYQQLLTYTVDEVFAQPGAAPSADHQRIAGALQQAFNTTDADYVDVIRGRFRHMIGLLRSPGQVSITCGGSGCRTSGRGFTAAYVVQPYALVLCSPGIPGNRPISTFIHEMGHATLPQVGVHNTVQQGGGIRDRAYTYERLFHHLSPEETLDNAESYGLLATLLHNRANRQVVMQQTDTTSGCAQPNPVLAAFARAEQWNRYATSTLSDYVRFLGTDPISNLPPEYRDPLVAIFPNLTTAALGDLKSGYESLNANGFSTAWNFACVSRSRSCSAGSLGYAGTGSATASSVSLRTIPSQASVSLCPAWFSASADDQIRSIYALFLIGRPAWIVARFQLANAYAYVELARSIALQRNPPPTTRSAFEHLMRDQPTAPPARATPGSSTTPGRP